MGAPVQADVPLPLAQRLARQIKAGGPISVAHYMAEANAHYYNSRDPLGAAGDFTTAPEIRQMFGELVGLWLADIWLRSGRKDHPDRKSVVAGTSVSVRVDLGGCRIIKKKKKHK